MYHDASPETISRRLASARGAGAGAVTAYMALRLARHAALRGASDGAYLLADGFTAAEILKYQRAARQLAPVIVPDERGLAAPVRPLGAGARGIIDAVGFLLDAQAQTDAAIARIEAILKRHETRAAAGGRG